MQEDRSRGMVSSRGRGTVRNTEGRLIGKEQAKEVLDVGDPSFRFLVVGIGFPPQLLHQLV